MKIGFVSQALPYIPSRGGFRPYGANLIRELSQRHELHLVSMLVEDDALHVDWARQYCASITTLPAPRFPKLLAPASAVSAHLWGRPLQQRRAMYAALKRLFERWDVIHIEGGYAAGIVPDLPIPKVLSLHDSWTLRCAEMLKCATSIPEKLYYWLLGFHEPRFARLVLPRFDYCTVVADRDLQAVREVAPDARLAVVPYGVDTRHYAPLALPRDPRTGLFHGNLAYGPNVDAALEFANAIDPLIRRAVPDFTFHIVAAEPVEQIRALASRPGTTLTVSPPDVRPAMSAARIYVCPMRYGTGMKNKILEAMAMALPIVCYAPAIAGIDCVPGEHVLVADNPTDFARHVVDLLHDPARAEALGRTGRSLVETHYSWDLRARAYEALYDRAIARSRRPIPTSVPRLQEANRS